MFLADRIYSNEGLLEKAKTLRAMIEAQTIVNSIYYALLLILWKCVFKQDRQDFENLRE